MPKPPRRWQTFAHFVPAVAGTRDGTFCDWPKLLADAFTVPIELIAGKIDATIVAAASALYLKIPMVLHINYFFE